MCKVFYALSRKYILIFFVSDIYNICMKNTERLFKMCFFKPTKILALFFAFILVFSGCGGGKISDYDKMQKRLVEMTSYICEADIKYISPKTENTYKAKQWVLSDGRYKIETTEPEEVKGNIILYDGNLLWQYNPKLESKISLNTPDKPERVQINIFTFLSNMVNSQDVGVESSSMDKSLYTVFEAKIPGNSKYFAHEKLWLDNETLNPARLEIYDTEGEMRAEVVFSSFEYNPKIEDDVFVLDNLKQ